MNDQYQQDGKFSRASGRFGTNYQKWRPILERHGFKARRYLPTNDGEFVASEEGWFRLSPVCYEKNHLQWVQNRLRYLDEQSFANWAAPWQKNMIWEEDEGWRLMQPWIFSNDHFSPGDPAGIERVAEILADLHHRGRDYSKSEVRDGIPAQWRTLDQHWQLELEWMDILPEDRANENVRLDLAGVRKATVALLKESIGIWQSGIHLLFESDDLVGSIGHGRLKAQDIVWLDNDFYLLDWENVIIQPKVADLAIFIENVGLWEPEWIVLFMAAYTQKQPLWPEEFQMLKLLLEYPKDLLELAREDRLPKLTREEMALSLQELQHKSRCLNEAWRELGARQGWDRRIWLGNGINGERRFPETDEEALGETFAREGSDDVNESSADQGAVPSPDPSDQSEDSIKEESSEVRSGKWSQELTLQETLEKSMVLDLENGKTESEENDFKTSENVAAIESLTDAAGEEILSNSKSSESLSNSVDEAALENRKSAPLQTDDRAREEKVLSWRSFPKTINK